MHQNGSLMCRSFLWLGSIRVHCLHSARCPSAGSRFLWRIGRNGALRWRQVLPPCLKLIFADGCTGSLAQAIYTTILANTQAAQAAVTVPAAAIAAGMSSENAQSLLAAFPLGAAAIAEVPGTTEEAIGAASLAFQWSYAHGLKIVALSSLSFGVVGLLCIAYCEDITPKMTNKVVAVLE